MLSSLQHFTKCWCEELAGQVPVLHEQRQGTQLSDLLIVQEISQLSVLITLGIGARSQVPKVTPPSYTSIW